MGAGCGGWGGAGDSHTLLLCVKLLDEWQTG